VVVGAVVTGAVVVIAAAVGAAVYFVKARSGDARLIGTWQSDADLTIAELRKAKPVTDQQEQAYRKLFGHMKVTYTATNFTTDWDGVPDKPQSYQVVSKDRDSAVVKAWSAASKKEENFRIRFVGSDTYWVDVEPLGMSECFRRVK
jgi:hypothetical protein